MKTLIEFFKRRSTNRDWSQGRKKNKSMNRYFCPMKCEGDKFYDTPGSCPECHMILISTNSISESVVHSRCNI